MLKKIISLSLISLSITFLHSQEIPKEYAKKYELLKSINNHTIIKEKKNSHNILVLDHSGQIIAEFEEKKPLIFLSNNGKIYYASNIKGFNDGGGWITTGFRNVEILNLNDKSVQQFEYEIKNLNYDKHDLIIIQKDSLVGAINKNDEIVLKPLFKTISPIGSDRKNYYAFDGKEYFVTDNLGKNILEKNFIYNRKNKRTDGLSIGDTQIEGSYDGEHFGIYNFVSKKIILPFEYDQVLIKFNKSNYFNVYKNDTCALFDVTNNSFVVPFELGASYVSDIEQKILNNEKVMLYIFSKKTNTKSLYNIYANGKELIQADFEIKDIKLNSFPYITGRNYDNQVFIYDAKQNMLLMNYLEYIDGTLTIEPWKERNDILHISAKLDHPKIEKGRMSQCSMLIDTSGNVLIPFQSHQGFRNLVIDNKSILMNFLPYHGKTVTFRLDKDNILAKDISIHSTQDVTIIDNKIYINQLPTASFTIPNKGTFKGGIITIDSKGNLDHIPVLYQERRPSSTKTRPM